MYGRKDIENLKNLMKKESDKEFPDTKVIKELNKQIMLMAIGLSFLDVNPRRIIKP